MERMLRSKRNDKDETNADLIRLGLAAEIIEEISLLSRYY